MATFGTQEWIDEQKPKGLPMLWVTGRRKDGKFSVTYGFTGRHINKIITAEKLEAERASGNYNVR